MPFVTKEAEKYYYTRTGNTSSPQTLLFVHGATMTGAGLAPFADLFGEFNCITVDLPGHGHSEGPTKATVEEFADSMEYLIHELVRTGEMTDHITVLGFSMGGCITVDLALRKLKEIRRVIILSSGAGLRGHTPYLDTVNVLNDSEFKVDDVFHHVFGDYSTPQQKELETQVLMGTKVADSMCLTDLRTACYYDRQSETSSIETPMLIIIGDQDQLVPVEVALRLRISVPGSALQVLPYRGHSAIYEETETVLKTIHHFFQLHP